jgi:hypothetical protein
MVFSTLGKRRQKYEDSHTVSRRSAIGGGNESEALVSLAAEGDLFFIYFNIDHNLTVPGNPAK